MPKQITQTELVMEYFESNPNRPIPHPEVVDWLTSEYEGRTGQVFRDPDRTIRKLAQEGKLVKLGKGLYKYDPELISKPQLSDFTIAEKEQIFRRDNYRCVICGKGRPDGVEKFTPTTSNQKIWGAKQQCRTGKLCAPPTTSAKKLISRLKQEKRCSSDYTNFQNLKAIVKPKISADTSLKDSRSIKLMTILNGNAETNGITSELPTGIQYFRLGLNGLHIHCYRHLQGLSHLIDWVVHLTVAKHNAFSRLCM